jgi:hypothetical protein
MGEFDSCITERAKANINRKLDPTDFACRLRGLALDAHRTLRLGDAGRDRFGELSSRIDELRFETVHPSFAEIDRWLENTRVLLAIRD